MKAGEIIQRWHQFNNGECADKLFICLNDADDKNPAVLVITTSVQRQGQNSGAGCSHYQYGTYYVIHPSQADCFKRLTFVQLHRRWLFSVADILKESLVKRNYVTIGTVSEQTLNAIIKCFDSSPDIDQLTRDIVQASRKARQQPNKLNPLVERGN